MVSVEQDTDAGSANWFSGVSTQKYGANCDKSVKIWTNEGYIKLIRFRPGAILAKHVYRLNFNKIQDGGQLTEKCYISTCSWDKSEILTGNKYDVWDVNKYDATSGDTVQCKWKEKIKDGGQLPEVNSEILYSQLVGKMAMESQCYSVVFHDETNTDTVFFISGTGKSKMAAVYR